MFGSCGLRPHDSKPPGQTFSPHLSDGKEAFHQLREWQRTLQICFQGEAEGFLWSTVDTRRVCSREETCAICIGILPIGSMYGIYGNIYHQYTPNVSIYTIHGSYGLWIVIFASINKWTYFQQYKLYSNIFKMIKIYCKRGYRQLAIGKLHWRDWCLTILNHSRWSGGLTSQHQLHTSFCAGVNYKK
jgi:hypothetical protein